MILLVGILLGFAWRNGRSNATRSLAPQRTADISGTSPENSAVPRADDQSPTGVLARFFSKIQDGDLKPGDLDAFRRAILDAPRGEAIRALVAFLATGR